MQRHYNDRIRKYLSKYKTPEYIGYHYPVSEGVTRVNEEKQDSGKRARERAIISHELRFHWEVALDFGCGQGANFDLFSESDKGRPDKFLYAVDPDPARIAEAELNAVANLTGIDYALCCHNIAELENFPKDIYFDAILCCQVLGHLTTRDTDRVISELCKRVARGGRILFLYPVCFPSVHDLPFAKGHIGGDLFHEVNTTIDPEASNYRTLLTASEFDSRARDPNEGRLPVRSFLMPQLDSVSNLSLPVPMAQLPPSIGKIVPRSSDTQTMIYSVHEFDEHSGLPAVADAATVVYS